MADAAKVVPLNIADEMRDSYLDYAMSVIIGRAIPDGRDGLKPVHRRILYAMYREGLLSSKRYSKSAGVVGEVLKKYHPHGDMAVYDSLVRMAQEWNLRYPLIDGQGNFGSIDGDSAAAYRYTEARLTQLAEEILADIDKDTVDFIPNFDESTQEPVLLPSRIPNLLINGSDGIAVGMATKIPPHNLSEIINGLIALVKKPSLSIGELTKLIPGPDFPTGAFVHGMEGIKEAYSKGKGILQLRARTMIEPVAKGDRENIIVSEIPFQVNKARLIEKIAELIHEGKIEGVSDLRDESDKDGLRIVIELKKGTVAGVILNQLFKHTAMQTTFGIILLAIVDGQPKILNIKSALELFLDHRKNVVIRRTAFELKNAEQRAHILEGLKIALDNLDAVISLIRKSKSPQEAKTGLIKKYSMSEIQAQAILEMRLQRLTALEREKILEEYEEIQTLIKKLKAILKDEQKVWDIIVEELQEIKDKYGDVRRTEIIARSQDLSVEDLITEEEMVVTLSHTGYIKRNPISIYRAQRRGGRGKTGMTIRDEDFVSSLFIASTHHYLLIFSTKGRVYWVKVHEIPQAGRTAKGKPIANLIQMSSEEKIAAVLPVRQFEEGKYVTLMTKNGTIKKTDLMAFSRPRVSGIIALTIDDDDLLIGVSLTDGQRDIFIGTREGQAIRFNESQVRSMGRSATGVRGIGLAKNDSVIGFEALHEGNSILTVTENGFGKRTDVEEYRQQGRGGSGVITIKTTDRNGFVIGVNQVNDADDVMIITNRGKIIRMKVNQISIIGRNTQGVRLISLESGEKVVGLAKLAEKEESDA
ncbi:MAG: DNA gyrase subunit A [Deltaproteobacteria bacterium RIFCSPLOWO2_02_FULL_50_16]|nr:MAG: DNA gyrase subunit A [Deltaproteobacteria bacterium RIFCSPHIGHO2_02_FULL_50_15]OGQ57200.1 MAG: DNA gyrase subunit A [Deltaproteobacteria bacterium RIFCSPLOWO2_02_FULL_50_16]OGQ66290.1 MAG: DNA gyrase subunit A [Deltaproteobacteria bacterium RIFCSPLOWO2_12_FULL_50_11]